MPTDQECCSGPYCGFNSQSRPMGPSINDVASLEGGGGVKLAIWGNLRGVGVKANPISSIFPVLEHLFLFLERLFHVLEHLFLF